MNTLNTCFTKGNDAVTRCIAGETIIVPVRAHVVDLDAIYTLNEVGTLIWNYIDGQTPGHQIVAAVCRTYDVTSETAVQDTSELLGSLEAAGLISPYAGSEG